MNKWRKFPEERNVFEMTRKNIEQLYRKFVNEEKEFQRFCLIERLKDDEMEHLLMAISSNLIPTYQRLVEPAEPKAEYDVVFCNHTFEEERYKVGYNDIESVLDRKESLDYIILIFNHDDTILYRSEYGRVVFNQLNQVKPQKERMYA